jgi:hypothetical protein
MDELVAEAERTRVRNQMLGRVASMPDGSPPPKRSSALATPFVPSPAAPAAHPWPWPPNTERRWDEGGETTARVAAPPIFDAASRRAWLEQYTCYVQKHSPWTTWNDLEPLDPAPFGSDRSSKTPVAPRAPPHPPSTPRASVPPTASPRATPRASPRATSRASPRAPARASPFQMMVPPADGDAQRKRHRATTFLAPSEEWRHPAATVAHTSPYSHSPRTPRAAAAVAGEERALEEWPR